MKHDSKKIIPFGNNIQPPIVTPIFMKHNFQHTDHTEQEHYRNPPSCGLPVDEGGPKHGLEADKAREILHDGTVHGKPITEKQRGYFGAVASGKAKK